ncbi:MAG: tail fiber domain-containing protein [Saprospiraceae bacterium]|nr:tail fiber domain-containing protein [Saprospiraceae bacterium]
MLLRQIGLLLSFLVCQTIFSQSIGLQVDSSQTVLFGEDTLCCGDRFMWLASKRAVFIGTMAYPGDTIGDYSFSFGRSRAVGNKTVAMVESLAEGAGSMAVGSGHSIGNYSFASGFSTTFGAGSAAFGNSIAAGYSAFAAGNSSTNGDHAVSFGISRSEGAQSASFNRSKADAFLCTTFGRYNVGGGSATEYVSTDPIFEVGIGANENNRRNAFTIRKDGFISLGNHLEYTKFALYESGASTYGMGVQAGQFRFNLGNPQARYAFFDQPGSGAAEIFTIYGNGTVAVKGTTVHSSDINRKEQIIPVSNTDILEKLRRIPITEWQYIGQTERHVGPMAQDFYRAFGLGMDEKTIASIDGDGIAMAAIQALAAENEALRNQLHQLEMRLTAMENAHSKERN